MQKVTYQHKNKRVLACNEKIGKKGRYLCKKRKRTRKEREKCCKLKKSDGRYKYSRKEETVGENILKEGRKCKRKQKVTEKEKAKVLEK